MSNGIIREKLTTKDPAEKLARKRYSVLELAKALGNISEACRRSGMDRTSFYEWRRRFAEGGIDALKDLPPIHHSHPQTTPPEIVAKIIALSMKNPSKGCCYLSAQLALEGISVSSPTVQDILIKHNMGSRYERWLKVEQEAQKEGIILTADQIKLLLKNESLP